MSADDKTDDPLAWGLPPMLPRERAIHEATALVRAVRARRHAAAVADDADREVEIAIAKLEEAKIRARTKRAERDRRRSLELVARTATTAAMSRAQIDRLEIPGARIVHAAAASRADGDSIELLARDSLRVYLDPQTPAQLVLGPLRPPTP